MEEFQKFKLKATHMVILKVPQMVAQAMAIIILIITKANTCSKLISQVNLKKCQQP